MEYSILFPTFAFFQNVFHLPFGDKSIIRFKASNSVQCISLNEFLAGEDREQKHDRVRNRARIGSTDLWRTRSEFVADTGEYIDTDNEYMYYYSAEFVK